MKLSTDDRRSLAVIAALLFAAGSARWLDRPRPILEDEPQLDLAAVKVASLAQDGGKRGTAKERPKTEKIAARSPEKIDPNKATVAQLMALPSVGPALAERIRAASDSAPFRSQADLTRVPGIGPAMVLKLAPFMTLPVASPGRPRPNQARQAPEGSALPNDATISLNAATRAELESIRGLGTVLASRILARRDSLGRFGDWSEVDEISGVGEAILARLKERVILRD